MATKRLQLIGFTIQKSDIENAVSDYFKENPIEALPEVTAEDNGKHMEVVDGAWTVTKQKTEPEVERTVILEEQTLQFSHDDSGAYTYVNAESIITLETGGNYIVEWDGTEYNCVGATPEEGSGVFFVGNMSIFESSFENTNEPFIIMTQGEYFAIATADTSASHTIAIYQKLSNDLPEVTTSDNGKLLQVINGKWTAVAITNGNEVAY